MSWNAPIVHTHVHPIRAPKKIRTGPQHAESSRVVLLVQLCLLRVCNLALRSGEFIRRPLQSQRGVGATLPATNKETRDIDMFSFAPLPDLYNLKQSESEEKSDSFETTTVVSSA